MNNVHWKEENFGLTNFLTKIVGLVYEKKKFKKPLTNTFITIKTFMFIKKNNLEDSDRKLVIFGQHSIVL